MQIPAPMPHHPALAVSTPPHSSRPSRSLDVPVVTASPALRERKPDALLWALAAMIFTYVWRIQDLFPFLGLIRISLLAGIVALLLFGADGRRERRIELIRSPILVLVLSLAGILVLGIPTSLWPGKSVTFLMKDFLPTVALMVMVAASVRSFRDLEWLARVNLIGAFMYALFVLVYFDPTTGGRLGNLVYYDSNDFALLMMASMPIAVFFLSRHSRFRSVVFPPLSLGLFVLMLMQSGSRGGFLAFMAVMLYMLLRYRAIPRSTRIGTVVFGLGMLMLVANEAYWTQMKTLLKPKEDYNWAGQQYGGRVEVWKRGVSYMLQRPILGVGARAFPQAEGTLSPIGREFAARGWGFKWSAAHNSFVEIGAEAGIIGLGLFLAILFHAFRTLVAIQRMRDPPATPRERAFAQTLIACLIGYMVAGFFLSAEYFAYLYVLLGMTMALQKVTRWNVDARMAAARALEEGGVPAAAPIPLRVARALRKPRPLFYPRPESGRVG